MRLLVNFVAFQVGWFAAVLGAANGAPWLGPAVLAVVLAIHFSQAERPAGEAGLIAACGAIGAVFDSVFVAAGLVAYPTGQWHVLLAPYWIIGMWMLFATTLNVSLKWLHGRQALALIVGAVAGPLSYLAGAKLGGMQFVQFAPAMIALTVGWGLALPLVVRVAQQFNGMTPSGVRA